MSQISVTPYHGRSCPGCMGNGECWVCIGSGVLNRPDGKKSVPCHRCHGSGQCSEGSSADQDERASA